MEKVNETNLSEDCTPRAEADIDGKDSRECSENVPDDGHGDSSVQEDSQEPTEVEVEEELFDCDQT